jgi:hypothetical protein
MNSQKLLSTNTIKSFDEANRIAITSITYTDSSYNDLDDTAVSSSGGNIKIRGYGFLPGATIYLNGSVVSNTYVSSSEYRAVVPAIASGTVNLMLFNPNSYGAVYTNGVATSGFPSFTSTSYTSPSFTVSVQLLATGDTPLTYSLYSGTLPSGLSLSSSGLISGTVTSDSTTNLVVLVNDAQNQTTQQNITLIVLTNDTYWKYTSLLITGENTYIANTAYNLDSSNNNSLITLNGDVTPSRFSPFASPTSSDGSTFFDGTGDYLTVSDSAAIRIGTSSFTIEGWFRATAIGGAQKGILAKGATAENTGWEIRIDGASGGQLATTFTSTVVKGTTVIALNTWYHFALVRNGTAVNLYLNGTSEASATRSDDFSQTESLYIGNSRTTAQPFTGYISNVRITKQALYTANFTPATSVLTTTSQSANSANVIFLGSLSNASFDNNRIVDLSSNTTSNLNFTRTGTPTVSSFSPYGTMWSSYFDGNGDYMSIAHDTKLDLGSGDFTVEFWIYPITWSGTMGVVGKKASDATSGWQIYKNAALSPTKMGARLGGTSDFFTGSDVDTNTWTHWALVRTGSTVYWFKNGTLDATGTNSTNLVDTSASLRAGYADTWSAYSHCHIASLRIVKGQALYTSNFTPSTTVLTTTSQSANSANVSLLTCQYNQFKDNSNNAFSITKFGDAAVTKFIPFTTSIAYSPETYVGSYYFNGSTDYYRIPTATTAFGFGTGNWTVEFWLYPNSVASNYGLIDFRTSGGGATQTKVTVYFNAAGSIAFYTGGVNRITQSSITSGQWYHIAVVKSSGTTKLYVNGIANATTYTDANDYATTAQFTIGTVGDAPGAATWWTNGFISDLRVVVGTAVYTGNFTPTTTPLTAIANTTMILNSKSSGVFDYAGQHALITGGNSTASTTQEKYGDRGLYFDGSGDYIQAAPTFSPLNVFTGDFTIEGWLYTTTVATGRKTICATRTTATDTTAGRFSLVANTANLEFFTASANVAFGGTISTNTWIHFAATRSSSNLRLFLNGTQVGSTVSYTGTLPPNLALTVGNNAAGTESWNGYLDEIRITKGYARYVANFTVPGVAYPQL